MIKILRPPCRCCNETFMGHHSQHWCLKPECQAHKKEVQAESMRQCQRRKAAGRWAQIKRDTTIVYHGKQYECQNKNCRKLSYNRFLCPECREQALTSNAGINGMFNVNA